MNNYKKVKKFIKETLVIESNNKTITKQDIKNGLKAYKVIIKHEPAVEVLLKGLHPLTTEELRKVEKELTQEFDLNKEKDMNNLDVTKILENIEKRKNTTRKGIKQVTKLYEFLKDLELENLGIHKSFNTKFYIETSFYDGENYQDFKASVKLYIDITDGIILNLDNSSRRLDLLDTVDYINFSDFNLAVLELFEFLGSLEPLEIELPILTKNVIL